MLLTCQGAPALMRWRGVPLMKNVFNLAMYPALIAELRPRTIFEIGSGLGASAAWLADHLAMSGIDGRVHSVDRVKVETQYPHVIFHHGDCAVPETLFAAELLCTAPHPGSWSRTRITMGRRSSATCTAIWRLALSDRRGQRHQARRVARFPCRPFRRYLVDTRFTDNFGRNATCAANSIFVRTEDGVAG